jgi:L-asparaginase II
MANPLLVEITRDDRVESLHRGSVAVVDPAGGVVAALGDIDHAVFPRSAVKVMQALPLVESGAADALGFGQRELALACASHYGEPEHVALAAAMLARAGCDAACLECGTQWPRANAGLADLLCTGSEPSALHNNCSGKHAGFVCTAVHRGLPVAGYVDAGHPVQEAVRQALAEVTATPLGPEERAVDGCSIPTYAIPLRNLAGGFARLASGSGLGRTREAAARRLMAACFANPRLVAGPGGFDTDIMTALPGRAFSKSGAEGVQCLALPGKGLGVAIKCDDGAGRAGEAVAAAILAALFPPGAWEGSAGLAARLDPPVLSRVGRPVGVTRVTEAVRGLAAMVAARRGPPAAEA